MKRLPKWREWLLGVFDPERHRRYEKAAWHCRMRLNERIQRIYIKAAQEIIDLLMRPM